MHEHAGRQARSEDLIDLDALTRAYFEIHPDPANVANRVAFGTSGHRGSSLDAAFNEDHILAVAQAIAEYRAGPGDQRSVFVGRDTHGLSEPAWRTTLEVLVANGVETVIDSRDGFTPTPAVSQAILEHNRIAPGRPTGSC
jgi:phosphoglucomutase